MLGAAWPSLEDRAEPRLPGPASPGAGDLLGRSGASAGRVAPIQPALSSRATARGHTENRHKVTRDSVNRTRQTLGKKKSTILELFY